MSNQKGFSAVEVIVVVVVAGLIGAVGWVVYDRQKSNNDQSKTSKLDAKTDKRKADTSSDKEQYTAPQGWVKYDNQGEGISFYYPSSWDKWGEDYPDWTGLSAQGNEFKVTRSSVDSTFLAPFGGGGGDIRYKYDAATKSWHQVTEEDTAHQKSSQITGLNVTSTTQTKHLVMHGRTGEGGGVSYFILITDGTNAYQIVFPGVYEEFDADTEGKTQEQAASAPKIIESIRFLSES